MHFFSRYSYIWKFESSLERDYEFFVRHSNLISLRLVSFITIFGMSIFLLIDLFKDVNYSIVLATRAFVLIGASLIMLLTYRKLSVSAIAWGVITVATLNFAASLITATYAGMPSYYITNLLFLIFVLVVTASGLHFRYALATNLFFLITFLLYSQFINQNPFYVTQYPHLISIFVYIHIVGMVLEGRRRKNFLQFNDLVEQKRLVEELNQQKNKVISILSHDVATPMSSLSKILYLQSEGKISDHDMKPFMNGLRNEINNVSYLLNGLVRWSRSQMQGFVLNKSQVDLIALINEKRDLFHLQLVEKNLKLEVDAATVYINVDEEMLRIAVRNLISNAIRFANVDSTINLAVRPEGQRVIIKVQNEGKSIPQELKDRLFTYQMPSMEDTKGERGAGLGLAMSAFFIRLHGGEIRLLPSPEGVTIFCVELPTSISKTAIA